MKRFDDFRRGNRPASRSHRVYWTVDTRSISCKSHIPRCKSEGRNVKSPSGMLGGEVGEKAGESRD